MTCFFLDLFRADPACELEESSEDESLCPCSLDRHAPCESLEDELDESRSGKSSESVGSSEESVS